MTTFVLVHGVGHGGWCFQPVARLLRAAGHEVHTPTLTGLGERSHLLDDRVDLELHIADIVNVLRFEDLHDVVLVGHSYGGTLITGVADRAGDRIAKLVYLDAGYVGNGQSVADTLGPVVEALRGAGTVVDGMELILLPDADGGPFYGVTDPDEQAFLRGRLTPFPWACFAQPLRLQDEAAVAAIPAFHVVCTQGPSNLGAAERAAATAEQRLWTLDTHHELMVSEPETVAAILCEVAGR
jgi:pimeloyl-ACP methyl ester carboxylesterase